MRVTRMSPLSGPHTLDLDITQAQLDEFEGRTSSGRLVQQIFPNLSPAECEFLMTGYTEEDWAKIFPPEEDEE